MSPSEKKPLWRKSPWHGYLLRNLGLSQSQEQPSCIDSKKNLGVVQVELDTADLQRIETAAVQIQVQGERYSETAQRMINR